MRFPSYSRIMIIHIFYDDHYYCTVILNDAIIVMHAMSHLQFRMYNINQQYIPRFTRFYKKIELQLNVREQKTREIFPTLMNRVVLVVAAAVSQSCDHRKYHDRCNINFPFTHKVITPHTSPLSGCNMI